MKVKLGKQFFHGKSLLMMKMYILQAGLYVGFYLPFLCQCTYTSRIEISCLR